MSIFDFMNSGKLPLSIAATTATSIESVLAHECEIARLATGYTATTATNAAKSDVEPENVAKVAMYPVGTTENPHFPTAEEVRSYVTSIRADALALARLENWPRSYIDSIDRVLGHMSVTAVCEDVVYFREAVRQAESKLLPMPGEDLLIHCCEDCRHFARSRLSLIRCNAPERPAESEQSLVATNVRNTCPGYCAIDAPSSPHVYPED